MPDEYLSNTAIEWGQIPSGYEELTTEIRSVLNVSRRTVRILPEYGCNIEDLPAQTSRAEMGVVPADHGLMLDNALGDNVWHLETVFPGLCGAGVSEKPGAIPYYATRTRLALRFDAAAGELRGSSISAWQERRWADEAGKLLLREGGGGRTGLDGAWVSSIVGAGCFGEKAPDGTRTDSELTLPALGLVVRWAQEAIEVEMQPLAGGDVTTIRRVFDLDGSGNPFGRETGALA